MCKKFNDCISTQNKHKNAFQQDAYQPLVDRMLESASRGEGVWSGGVSAPRGSGPGGIWSGGSGSGGCLLQGGLVGGCLVWGVCSGGVYPSVDPVRLF